MLMMLVASRSTAVEERDISEDGGVKVEECGNGTQKREGRKRDHQKVSSIYSLEVELEQPTLTAWRVTRQKRWIARDSERQ
jgi:hypothetical protein